MSGADAGTNVRGRERPWPPPVQKVFTQIVDEVIEVLAAQAPDPHQALDHARHNGHAFVVLDGTLLPTDRCFEQTNSTEGESIDLWNSGKEPQDADNVQAPLAIRASASG